MALLEEKTVAVANAERAWQQVERDFREIENGISYGLR